MYHRHTKRNDLQTSYKINYLQFHASYIRIEISGGKIRPRTQSRILPEIIVRCIQPCKLTKAIPRRRWWRFPSRFPLLTMSCNIAPILSRKDSNYTRAVAKCKVFFLVLSLADWFFGRLKQTQVFIVRLEDEKTACMWMCILRGEICKPYVRPFERFAFYPFAPGRDDGIYRWGRIHIQPIKISDTSACSAACTIWTRFLTFLNNC